MEKLLDVSLLNDLTLSDIRLDVAYEHRLKVQSMTEFYRAYYLGYLEFRFTFCYSTFLHVQTGIFLGFLSYL